MVTGNKKMDKMPDKEMRAKEKERMEKFLDHYHKARNIAIACKAYAKRRLKDIQAIINFQYNAEVGRKIFGAQNSSEEIRMV